MEKNPYDINEEKYEHVISLLKNLPRENAPSNFEYNLKIRIDNKNFESKLDNGKFYFPWRVAIPSIGTVAIIAIIFFSSIFDQEQIENPFQIQPQLRADYSSESFNDYVKNTFGALKRINENDVVIKLEQQSVASTDVQKETIERKIPEYLLNNGQSTDLDKVINPNKGSNLTRKASLAGRSSSRFSGFYMYNEIEKEEFERLKARNDSIRNVIKQHQMNR